MVLLFSGRKSKIEKEIIEILSSHGGCLISDKRVSGKEGSFTIVSCYKVAELEIDKGIAVFCDDTERFESQKFPKGIIGICEDSNTKALSVFKQSGIPVISCGMSSKNTVTLSSLENDTLFAALQRTVIDSIGCQVEPAEFKIKLTKQYQPFSVMASVAILLLNSIKPQEF